MFFVNYILKTQLRYYHIPRKLSGSTYLDYTLYAMIYFTKQKVSLNKIVQILYYF